MLLADLARTSNAVAATSSRAAKVALLAELFRAIAPDEAPVAVTYLAGRLPQRRIGVGWRTLTGHTGPAGAPSLTVSRVDAALAAIAAVRGRGAQAERQRLLRELMGAATEEEQHFLVRLITGELRQGALDALAVEGLAAAADADAAGVRRAVMLGGSLGAVARALLARGPGALADFRLTVGRPVQPMLAQTARDVDEALDRLGPCAVEEKLDGIRVQVHRDGAEVRVYTRTLDDITGRLPEVTDAARRWRTEQAVLDGEVIALDADGRPRPFQDVAGRVGSRVDVGAARRALPLCAVFFDLLAVEGRDLLGLPARERHAALAATVPEPLRVRRLTVLDPDGAAHREAARRFAGEVLARGHEGVVVKALDAPYSAGRRGASWLKVKPVHTLDLVVLAAEWGSGRRSGTLSNLHLGARRPDGSFAMLGKTFKGLTDALLAWQTERLQELAAAREPWGVRVRPELVVEIALDGVQRSPRYPEGLALRFARVVRYREDKRPEQADTVDAVRRLHTRAPVPEDGGAPGSPAPGGGPG
ncbi:ATP-dependent DNA ligase [Streptomyces sp. TRM 70351]|uniref:ATP-dependent DNA ligase n=1 Tax=Streptomyces sp. TRM 70351 TaxID=3116552 RepID=UPI002E7C26B2|nr:ATP-dependent DNA ligase [Streptomyces sp. TRM 70351]MEE1927073.1 ATP-dependent DNA ligase [Streptomyces sp. TRM 70351]